MVCAAICLPTCWSRQVRKLDFAGTPVLAFTIASPNLDAEGLSWFVDQTVARRLLSVKGVGAVSRVGGVQT